MVKKLYAEHCKKNSEEQYVRAIDFDWECAKVDRLQQALKDAISMIDETTAARQARTAELRALANMTRSELKNKI